MTTKEVLIAARDLIAEPEHWIKGAMAKRTRGSRVRLDSDHPDATCFCLLGAVVCAAGVGKLILEDAEDTLRVWLPANYNGQISDFNDARSTTHADVLAVLDCAIEAAP